MSKIDSKKLPVYSTPYQNYKNDNLVSNVISAKKYEI